MITTITKRKDLEVRRIMYNYFNFNGSQINDLAIVTSIEKPYIPEKSIDTISVSSRDGEIFDGAKYDPISIPTSLW